MKRGLLIGAGLLAAAALAASSLAATSSPNAGDWTGTLKVKGASGLSFTVTASGRKRVVANFRSAGNIFGPCARSETSVGGIPSANVSRAGKFKAVATENLGIGLESWTVTGTFTSKHAASGAVAIVIPLTSTKQCKFTVKWTAKQKAPAPPKHGATYKGKTAISGLPVKFHVSANGKKLTSVTWHTPIIGGTCPGISNNGATMTVHNLAIHGDKFSDTLHSGKISHGTGSTGTNSITGQFLAGHTAAGTISTSMDIVGFGKVCVGHETWAARVG